MVGQKGEEARNISKVGRGGGHGEGGTVCALRVPTVIGHQARCIRISEVLATVQIKVVMKGTFFMRLRDFCDCRLQVAWLYSVWVEGVAIASARGVGEGSGAEGDDWRGGE